MDKTERIIIGIDPGTNIMGYGIIRIESGERRAEKKKLLRTPNSDLSSQRNKGNKIELIKLDVIKLNSMTDHALKLKKIFEVTLSIMNEYKPDELAIEAPFFGKNVQSMLKLGRAQGVAMAAALYREIPIFEYSPKKVKQSITGSGNASKEQVAAMLKSMLSIQTAPKYLDATDGLAVAVCHYFQGTAVGRQQTAFGSQQKGSGEKKSSKSYTGWKAFITENPKRVNRS